MNVLVGVLVLIWCVSVFVLVKENMIDVFVFVLNVLLICVIVLFMFEVVKMVNDWLVWVFLINMIDRIIDMRMCSSI